MENCVKCAYTLLRRKDYFKLNRCDATARKQLAEWVITEKGDVELLRIMIKNMNIEMYLSKESQWGSFMAINKDKFRRGALKNNHVEMAKYLDDDAYWEDIEKTSPWDRVKWFSARL